MISATLSWRLDLPSVARGEKFQVSSVQMVDLKKIARPCGSSCSIVRESVAQKPLLSDVDRARTRRIVSSNLQISRNTLHDVPAVQAEILPLHKLLEQVSEE